MALIKAISNLNIFGDGGLDPWVGLGDMGLYPWDRTGG